MNQNPAIEYLKALWQYAYVDLPWWHAFYGLVVFGLPLLWIGAILLSGAFTAMQDGRQPPEKAVYLAWAVAFLCHFAAFFYWGLPALRLSWYHGLDPLTTRYAGVDYLWAFLWTVPYAVILAIDLIFFVIHAMAGSGAFRRAARPQKA